MKNVVNRAPNEGAKKNKFLSKAVPRGTRTIWRYFSALILLFTLGITQMWGDELCSATLTGITTGSNTAGVSQTGCTMKWDNLAFEGDNVVTISSSTYHKFNGSGSYVQLILTTGNFQAGDVVTVKIAGKDSSKKTVKYSLKADDGNSASGSASKTETDDVSYTLTADDIEDDGSIKIFRNSSTNSRYGSFSVTRSSGGDTQAPTLSSSVPANSATDVAVEGTIVLTFSEALASVDKTKFSLSGATIGTVAKDGSDATKVNVPYTEASNSSIVTLSVAKDAVADAAGNKSAALDDISFTTVASSGGGDPEPVVDPWIIKVALSGDISSATKTMSGSIGGDAAYSGLQNSEAPYKIGGNSAYLNLTLSTGYFQPGDSVVLDLSKTGQIFWGATNNDADHLLGTTTSKSGIHYYILPASFPANTNTIHVGRTSSTYNGTVSYMAVYRIPICPSGLTISGEKDYVPGDKIELTASLAKGNGEISYQWYKGSVAAGNEIEGATSAKLEIADCVAGDAGDYFCVASKAACGDAVNASAYTITVNAFVPVTTITISPASPTVEAKSKITLTAEVLPADATEKTIAWSVKSGSEAYASVNATTGEVTGKAEGNAVIVATATDGSGVFAEKTVVVTPFICPTKGEIASVVYDLAKKPSSEQTIPGNSRINMTTYATVTNAVAYLGNTGGSGNAKVTTSKFKLGGSQAYAKLELDCALKEGDTIRLDNSTTIKLSLDTAKTAAITVSLASGKHDYIVPAEGDNLSTIFVWQNGSNVEFSYVKVIRPAKYDVTFNMQGHGTQVEPQNILGGGKVEEPATTDITGWDFGGWFTNAACSEGKEWAFATATVSQDTVLYAKWTVHVSSNDVSLKTLSVNGDAVTIVPSQLVYAVELPFGTTATPTVTATANDENVKAFTITQATAVDGSATIYVKAEDNSTEATYTINFSVATSKDIQLVFKTGTTPCVGSASTDAQILSNNAAVSTYIKQITFTNVEGAGDDGAEGSSLNVGKKAGNMFTLSAKAGYAIKAMQFAAKIQDATCEYSLDGGDWTTLSSTKTDGDACYTVFSDEEVREFRLRSTGASGVWIRNMELTIKEKCSPKTIAWIAVPAAEYEVGKSATAIAAEANNGTVTYASTDEDVLAVAADGALTVKALGTVKLSASVAAGDGKTYCAEGVSVEKEGIKVYALVTFNPDNGDAITPIKYYAGDAAIALPADPVKLNHNFLGWFNGDDQVTSAITPTASMDIVAHWETSYVAQIGENFYADFDEAIAYANANEGSEIILLQDVTRDTRITMTTSATLNLNGHTFAKNDGGWLIFLEGGTFTVNGTTDNSEIHGGIAIGKATNVNANLVLNGGYYHRSGAVLHTNGTCLNSNVTINGATIESESDNAIQFNGYGIYNVDGATITGATGIYVKSGVLNVTNSTVTGNMTPADYSYNGNGANATGDGIVVDACNYPGGAPTINIISGEFSGTKSAVGSYNYQGTSEPAIGGIEGGSFNTAVPKDLCAPGLVPSSADLVTGKYTVEPKQPLCLIKATVTGNNTLVIDTEASFFEGTPSIYAVANNSATYEEKTAPKFQSNGYLGVNLTTEGASFAAGDIVKVFATKAVDGNVNNKLYVYSDQSGTAEKQIAESDDILAMGYNEVALSEAATAVYLCRAGQYNSKWNPCIYDIAVYRAYPVPVLEAISINGIAAVKGEGNTFSVKLPANADLADLTVIEKVMSNDPENTHGAIQGAWALGDNTYRVTDADGDYADYTISVAQAAAIDHVEISGTLSVNETENTTLTAVVYDVNSDVAEIQDVTWSTANAEIATVVAGVVTGVAPGSVEITATSVADNTKKATVTVTVNELACRVWNAPAETFTDPATVGKLTITKGTSGEIALVVLHKNGNADVKGYTFKVGGNNAYCEMYYTDGAQFESLELGVSSNTTNEDVYKYVVVASSAKTFDASKVLSAVEYDANHKDATEAVHTAITLPEGTRNVRIYRSYDNKGSGKSMHVYYVSACKKELVPVTAITVADGKLAIGKSLNLAVSTTTPATADIASYTWSIESSTATGVTLEGDVLTASTGATEGNVVVKVVAKDALNNEVEATATITIVNKFEALKPVAATQVWDWTPVAVGEGAEITAPDTVLANYLGGEEWEMLAGNAGGRPYRSATYQAYQGTSLSFEAAVPGMLIMYAGRTSNDKDVFVNGTKVGTVKSDKAYMDTIAVPAGLVRITSESMRIYWMKFDTEFGNYEITDNHFNGYTRDVTEGRYGTICLENGGVMVGATLYEVAYYGETSKKIFFDEIIDGTMEAGVPYIYLPNEGAEQLGVFYTDAANESAKSANGLIGYIGASEDPSDAAPVPHNEGYYILNNNQYREVVYENSAYVLSHRAYIKLAAINPTEQALAPGRRRISMNVQQAEVATGMDNLYNGEQPMKVMIDGQMYILRGEKMYDATGRLVK